MSLMGPALLGSPSKLVTSAFTTHATGRSGPAHGNARRGDDEDKSTHTVVHVRPFNLFALQGGGAAVVWLEIAANFFERAVAEWVRWWSLSHEPPPATFGALSGPNGGTMLENVASLRRYWGCGKRIGESTPVVLVLKPRVAQ